MAAGDSRAVLSWLRVPVRVAGQVPMLGDISIQPPEQDGELDACYSGEPRVLWYPALVDNNSSVRPCVASLAF